MSAPGDNCVIAHDAASGRWLRFQNPLRIIVAENVREVEGALREVEGEIARGRYAAGFVAYEAAPAFDAALAVHAGGGFPLAWFGVYGEPEDVELPCLSDSSSALRWQPSVTREEYQQALARIREYISAGDTYQVNFTFRLQTAFSADPWAYFTGMIAAQGSGYGAFVQTADWAVCCASPELFFSLNGSELVSRPMKGTARRGLSSDDDRAKAAWLRASEKNRAENVMIVDMVRNDLGRIAAPGSVRVESLFDVEKYPTVWQMTSLVRGETQAGIGDVFGALFPPASITGAPKVRTMQIIAELETTPRRIYTGSIGFAAPGRRAQFNVAIRTVLVDRRQRSAEYGVGGGIVWDSEAADELAECATKARILTQVRPDFDLLETMRWTPGHGYDLLDRHLRRLADSAAYFLRPVDMASVRVRLDEAAKGLPSVPHRIRLLVAGDGTARIEAEMLKALPEPYRVRFARAPVAVQDPFLYHKTTHRPAYETAAKDAAGCEDVLLWNECGEMTESCVANVVLELDGRRVTPPVRCGLLAGTYRELLLERGEIEERVVRVEDLAHCARIWLCNSVRGLWPVQLAE